MWGVCWRTCSKCSKWLHRTNTFSFFRCNLKRVFGKNSKNKFWLSIFGCHLICDRSLNCTSKSNLIKQISVSHYFMLWLLYLDKLPALVIHFILLVTKTVVKWKSVMRYNFWQLWNICKKCKRFGSVVLNTLKVCLKVLLLWQFTLAWFFSFSKRFVVF